MEVRRAPRERPPDCPRCKKRPANKGTGYCWPCTILLAHLAGRAYEKVRDRDRKMNPREHTEMLVSEAKNAARLMEADMAEQERTD
jgi:ribosomal protein L37AE/L43A